MSDLDYGQYWQTILGLVSRHGLTSLAGVIVHMGWIQQDQTDSFVTMGVGIVTGAAGVIWSYVQKKRAAADKEKAVVAAAVTGVVPTSGRP